MNTAQLDHLRAIVAHLDRLLGIAAKRTPGEWVHFTDQGQIGDISTDDRDSIAMTQERVEIAQMADLGGNWRSKMVEVRNNNAAYIAACSNNAEAGWRSTKAAIECGISMGDFAAPMLESILAEWPLETLKP